MLTLNYETASLRVCVDSTADGRLSGRVLGRRLTREVPFSDVGGLLLQLEAVLDSQKSPQAFQRGRSFSPRQTGPVPAAQRLEEGMDPQAVRAARGREATFDLQIVTRRNATWQGTVDWLDGAPPQPFRSVLELVKQLDQRLSP